MRKRCVLTLFAAIIWLAIISATKGETRIEVDENGDEYELKRFYIQGRQLNGSGSKSQCVVTRRKRASRSMALPGSEITVNSQQLNLGALPTNPEHREGVVVDQETGKRRYVALTAVQLEEEEDDDEEEEELENDDDNENEEEEEVELEMEPQIVQLPLKSESQQKQLQTNRLAATFALPASLQQGVSVVASAATHANVGGDAGIVVVESEQPPKVNPSTHAVFELKPLSQQQTQPQIQYWPQPMREEAAEDIDDDKDIFYYGGDRYEEVGYIDEHFISEDSPMSTTAIWSTNNDDVHPVINEPNQPMKEKKKRKKPSQEPVKRRNKKKQQRPSEQDMDKEQKVKRKQQNSDKRKKPTNSDVESSSGSSSTTTNKRKRPSSNSNSNRRKTDPNKRQQQKKKNKRTRPDQSVSSNKRRRPSNDNSSSLSSSSRPIGGYRRRRPSQSPASSSSQKRRRQQQQEKRRRQQEQQRRRRRRNKNRNQNLNRRRQYYDNEPIINCIYINKDPPPTTTTTARPFWNILGRDAAEGAEDTVLPAGTVEESQVPRNTDFGLRKRTNLRFVA